MQERKSSGVEQRRRRRVAESALFDDQRLRGLPEVDGYKALAPCVLNSCLGNADSAAFIAPRTCDSAPRILWSVSTQRSPRPALTSFNDFSVRAQLKTNRLASYRGPPPAADARGGGGTKRTRSRSRPTVHTLNSRSAPHRSANRSLPSNDRCSDPPNRHVEARGLAA